MRDIRRFEPRQDLLTPYDNLRNSVDLPVHFVNEVNVLVNGRVVAVFLLSKPLAQGNPAKKHFPIKITRPEQTDHSPLVP